MSYYGSQFSPKDEPALQEEANEESNEATNEATNEESNEESSSEEANAATTKNAHVKFPVSLTTGRMQNTIDARMEFDDTVADNNWAAFPSPTEIPDSNESRNLSNRGSSTTALQRLRLHFRKEEETSLGLQKDPYIPKFENFSSWPTPIDVSSSGTSKEETEKERLVVSMGFSTESAKDALEKNGWDVQRAINHLLTSPDAINTTTVLPPPATMAPLPGFATPVPRSPTESISNIEYDTFRKPRELPSFLACRNKSVRKHWKYATLVSALVSIIVAVFLICFSLKKVSSTQYGVEYSVWSKKLESMPKTAGLHLGPVGYRFIKFPSTQINADFSDSCVSNDGIRVTVEASYQFRLDTEKIMEVILNYRDFNRWSEVVNIAGSSAIQHSCSAFNITDFQSKRVVVQDLMFENLRTKLEGDVNAEFSLGTYALAISLQLKFVSLPANYTQAIEQRQSSEEDISLARNERILERTKAQTEKKVAEKKATILLARAYNEGNITLIVANYHAQHTLFAFEKELQVLSQAKDFLSLSTDGILSYMANKLYATTPYLNVRAGVPARISRKNQLAIGA